MAFWILPLAVFSLRLSRSFVIWRPFYQNFSFFVTLCDAKPGACLLMNVSPYFKSQFDSRHASKWLNRKLHVAGYLNEISWKPTHQSVSLSDHITFLSAIILSHQTGLLLYLVLSLWLGTSCAVQCTVYESKPLGSFFIFLWVLIPISPPKTLVSLFSSTSGLTLFFYMLAFSLLSSNFSSWLSLRVDILTSV